MWPMRMIGKGPRLRTTLVLQIWPIHRLQPKIDSVWFLHWSRCSSKKGQAIVFEEDTAFDEV
jgi:hypothetical protein